MAVCLPSKSPYVSQSYALLQHIFWAACTYIFCLIFVQLSCYRDSPHPICAIHFYRKSLTNACWVCSLISRHIHIFQFHIFAFPIPVYLKLRCCNDELLFLCCALFHFSAESAGSEDSKTCQHGQCMGNQRKGQLNTGIFLCIFEHCLRCSCYLITCECSLPKMVLTFAIPPKPTLSPR